MFFEFPLFSFSVLNYFQNKNELIELLSFREVNFSHRYSLENCRCKYCLLVCETCKVILIILNKFRLYSLL